MLRGGGGGAGRQVVQGKSDSGKLSLFFPQQPLNVVTMCFLIVDILARSCPLWYSQNWFMLT